MVHVLSARVRFLAEVCRPLGLSVLPVTGFSEFGHRWSLLVIRPSDTRVIPMTVQDCQFIVHQNESVIKVHFNDYFNDAAIPMAGSGLVLQQRGVVID